jgi:hypothetical protein
MAMHVRVLALTATLALWLVPGLRGHALSWIDESTAQAEIGGDEYAILSEVPGDKALPGAQPFAPAAR